MCSSSWLLLERSEIGTNLAVNRSDHELKSLQHTLSDESNVMSKGPVWDPSSNEPEFFQHGRGIRKFGDPLHVVCRRAKVGASLVWRKV